MARKLTRRSFTRASFAAGLAAFSAPLIVPSRANGANDRVVLGMIGVGNRGRQLLGQFKGRCDVGAVADVYQPRAQEVAKSLGCRNVYHDYRKLLEQSDIDAVVITTPHRWHALNAIHAAQAGKDIFCEKPQTYAIPEGRRIVEAVTKYGRVFQTGSQQRSGVKENTGFKLIDDGAIGKIKKAYASVCHSPMEIRWPEQPVPEGLDWDTWCGPAEPPPYNFVIWDNRSVPSWVSVRTFSGGETCDWGAHGLDMLQRGLGMCKSGPEEIWTEGEPFKPYTSCPETPGKRHWGPSEPKVFMKYPGDILVEFGTGPSRSGARFEGENGSITVTRGRFSSDPAELAADAQPVDSVGHADNWLDCIKTRQDPVACAEIGHRSVTICHLVNIARWVSEATGETGQKLKWDARAERFTNSDVANSFLMPPYRKGYELPETV